MKRAANFASIWVLLFAFSGCNEELGPLHEPSGFSGVIRFTNWPPADSIREMRLVAFEVPPTDSAGIIPLLIAGTAAAYPPITQDYLPTLVDSVSYEFTTQVGTNLQVTNYLYVAVMYQFGPNILADWRPAGLYSTRLGSFEPAPLRVLLHRITPGVNIDVDFKNLPPIPWR
jgi:hypothetical protein